MTTPVHPSSLWKRFVDENAFFIVGVAFVLFFFAYAWLAPRPVFHSFTIGDGGASQYASAPSDELPCTMQVGDADVPLNRLNVGAIQPMSPSDSQGGTAILRDVCLVAPRDIASVIGGLPKDAPPGVVPAPILITNAIVDRRITLQPNVTLGANVILR